MIEENLFRPLPRPTQQNFNPEEDEPFLDPEYEHIGMFKNEIFKSRSEECSVTGAI